MEFGVQFFPDVGPAERSAEAYWSDALHLTGLCDELAYTTVRTVEHYFHRYGGPARSTSGGFSRRWRRRPPGG